jgi:hypothetical protein
MIRRASRLRSVPSADQFWLLIIATWPSTTDAQHRRVEPGVGQLLDPVGGLELAADQAHVDGVAHQPARAGSIGFAPISC